MADKLNELVSRAEYIGVIGSPSTTTELALDILARAVNKKLVGELAFFQYPQDGSTNYALGQITEVKLRNIWHEDPTMRSLIRQRGRVDAVSERQDTHQGEMIVSAVFANSQGNYRPSMLGTVPATGTPIYLANDALLQELLSPYQSQIFYLGHVYGSTPKLPLWFKHFERGSDGAGEAYHIGVFGKTGSGKSVLAKQILLAYSRYPQMGLLVIDPQGEFSKDVQGQYSGEYQLPMREVLRRFNKKVRVYSVRDLVLDRWNLFEEIIVESGFFRYIGVRALDNQRQAAQVLAEQLRKDKIKLVDLHKRQSFDKAWERLEEEKIRRRFYGDKSALERVSQQMSEVNKDDVYHDVWLPATQLFRSDRQGAKTIESILFGLFNLERGQRPLVVVDLSKEQALSSGEMGTSTLPLFRDDEEKQTQKPPLLWNDTIQALVIRRLLEGIRNSAEYAYREGQGLNTLVLIDEAHRLAPRGNPDKDELRSVRNIFIDAVRTTRKYGVGWMFISQTLSSLHQEIIGQLRIFFFGFGLGMGAEFKALSELVGGRSKALDLYQLFRDPHSSFDVSSREYSFMTIGPVSPLSFAGTPLFLNAFTDVQEFLESNQIHI